MGKAKRLTKVEKKFVQTLLANLPPVIARKEVTRFLGGIVAPQTLSNADASGEGPEDAFSRRKFRCLSYRVFGALDRGSLWR